MECSAGTSNIIPHAVPTLPWSDPTVLAMLMSHHKALSHIVHQHRADVWHCLCVHGHVCTGEKLKPVMMSALYTLFVSAYSCVCRLTVMWCPFRNLDLNKLTNPQTVLPGNWWIIRDVGTAFSSCQCMRAQNCASLCKYPGFGWRHSLQEAPRLKIWVALELVYKACLYCLEVSRYIKHWACMLGKGASNCVVCGDQIHYISLPSPSSKAITRDIYSQTTVVWS